MRKPAREVGLDDVISSHILGDDPEILAIVLRVHLALEAILIELIRTFRNDDEIFRLSFPTKTDLLEKHGVISVADKAAFDRFNDFRNDFAHIFGHKVTLEDTLSLARNLETYGVDFSDSVGQYSFAEAMDCYGGTQGVLEEVGWCILFHAAYCLSEAGGREIFSE